MDNVKNSKTTLPWEFSDDYGKFCIQNILSKVTSVAMLVEVDDKDCLDTLERCTTLAVTLTDQIKYLDSETIVDSEEMD